MMMFLRYLSCLASRVILSLRYRIRVEGLEEVRGLDKTLILPNHPAYMDPPIVIRTIWPTLRPRPVLLEELFKSPVLSWVPLLFGAVKIPDIREHSRDAREQAEAAIDEVVSGLRRGESFVLWPSGRAQRGDRERLYGSRSTADILRQVPDANVVLVRTYGLRGSMFSYARTASRPDLMKCFLRGFGILLANFLLFTPRRNVLVTIRKLAPEEIPAAKRSELNPFLEAWYNEPGLESPVHVPYHFAFGARSFDFPIQGTEFEGNPRRVSAEVKAAVLEIIREKTSEDLDDQPGPEKTLDELGLDSIDQMELSLQIEQRFGFSTARIPTTIGELNLLAAGLVESVPPKPPAARWFSPRTNVPTELLGDTLARAFVRRAIRCAGDVVVADDLSGVLTYERMLVGARLLARRFRRIEAGSVGILLPASAATDTVFFALHLGGKLPVLLNWTTGPANLLHATRTMDLTHVVTSRRFIDRAQVTIEGVEFVFLEDVRKGMSKIEQLAMLLATKLFPGRIEKNLPETSPEEPAVVLFTSGSEKSPKSVPLSHRNILSNIQGVFTTHSLNRADVFLGFLPAFHSFGLTVTSMLPILGGCRLVHHPDPTDAAGLLRKVTNYEVSVLPGTPTFVSYILDRVEADELKSLRMLVVGAEKCPQVVFDRVHELAPEAAVYEGYGITECSPLVSCNRPDATVMGSVGLPLPDFKVMVVDPESFEELGDGEVGMLLVSGASVFAGYYDYDGPQPFRDIDGRSWFITGDLVRLDEKGFILFQGRLKRFIKVAGEMISLPALEEPFAERFAPSELGPRVAVEGVETESGRRIVLFCTEDLSLRDANAFLVEKGFHGIFRLDEVRRIDEIPVLGTGKIDYKILRKRIEASG